MHYREIQPRPPLSRYVECYWVLNGSERQDVPEPQRILPDGCVEVIFNFADPFCYDRGGGELVRQPLQMVVGQMRQSVLIQPTDRVDLLGVRFHPYGAFAVFGVPAVELTDRMFGLDEIASDLGSGLKQQLDPLLDERKRIAAVESALLSRLARSRNFDAGVEAAVWTILRFPGEFRVEDLGQALGTSRRHLERRFLKHVGLGPKMLGRIIRFQRVFEAVEACDANWAVVAASCGYCDQAHLINDCRQFSGQTPRVLLEEQRVLTEIFQRKKRVSHFSNTAI